MSKWMDAPGYVDILRSFGDLDIDSFFGLTEETDLTQISFFGLTEETDLTQIFFAETAYLNYWDQITEHLPDLEGIDFGYGKNGNQLEVQISCDNKEAGKMVMQYTLINPTTAPTMYALKILHNNEQVYLKLPSHNPMIEWEQNLLAEQNILDEDGKPYFSD